MTARNMNKADIHKEKWMDEAWKCYELRLKGMSLRQIAPLVGLSRGTVAKRLEDANRAIVLPGVEEMRKMEDERLDKLLSALDRKIDAGDTRAIEVAIKLHERRAKLHGLDRPAEMNVTVHEIDDRDRELAELTREYMTRKHMGNDRDTSTA